jgi:hypothetical protein
MITETLTPSTCIVRDTAARPGRTLAVAPGRTATRYLHYGRIILRASDDPVGFATGERETGLVCLAGSATVSIGDQSFALERYDALYVGREEAISPSSPRR